MSNSIRHWMNIVEAVIGYDLLNRISPFTVQGRKNSAYISKIQDEINNEESGLLTDFGKYAEFYNFNKNNSSINAKRNEHYVLIDKLRKFRDKAEIERKNEIAKRKQERQAKLDGYKKSGADEYKNYIDAAKKQVAKTASKQASKLSKQRHTISIMAKRKLR